jgi:two-component system, NarL family, nitrate/nitrite response regulator NarL
MYKQVDLALLVDDNDVDLFIQKRFIEIAGFAKDIKAYNSPTQAINYLQEGTAPMPQIIFLDLNMPDMDGFGFMERFLQLPKKIQEMARVVILTSSSNQSDKKRAEGYSSVTNFLSKPLSLEALKSLRDQMKA